MNRSDGTGLGSGAAASGVESCPPMTASSENAPCRRGFLRNSHLWLLAAILGAGTVYALMTMVHDTSQRRAAAGIVARTMAERVAATAARRLEVAAIPALAPASRLIEEGDARRVVDDLAREQAAAGRCSCRPVLPATAFFAFDLGRDSSALIVSESAVRLPASARSALSLMARSMLDRGTASTAADTAGIAPDLGETSPIRLRLDRSLEDQAAVALVRRDTRGAPTGVVGMLVPVGALMQQLFSDAGAAVPSADSASGERALAVLDSASLEVRSADDRIVMGGLDGTRRFRATVRPAGALEGLAITVALFGSQIAPPLLSPVRAPQLWHLAALMLATVVVIVIAVRASAREAQLARARSDFIAGVSHELRMPLAQVLLASETLAMQRERDETARITLASSIVREARRLIALVENVLLFSRTGAVELRPHLEPVVVADLLADVVEAVELAVEDAGQHIEIAATPSNVVLADRTLVRQALVNLVDNAIKYGIPGQRIRLVSRQPSPTMVRLIVEDEGRGIPDAERARVFEPYERLDRDQSSERTGTGLGLAVVRQIATACNGRVWLEATEGGGTRAVLELPAATHAREPARPVIA